MTGKGQYNYADGSKLEGLWKDDSMINDDILADLSVSGIGHSQISNNEETENNFEDIKYNTHIITQHKRNATEIIC